MSFNWNEMEVFCVVAREGSFTRAAERLNQPKSSVSRAVANLEATLGVRLMERSTRRLQITDAGRDLLEQLGPLFEQLHDVVEESQAQRDQPQGILRISTPFEFGVLQLNELICQLLARYSGLEAEIEMSTERQHPLEGNFDLVFSLHDGDPEDSSLVARRVFTLPTVLCASPLLVQRFGAPQQPKDLAHWPCLCDDVDTVWRFSHRGSRELQEVAVHGRLRTRNPSLRLGAAEAALGASVISRMLCREAIEAGRLVHLLPDYQTMPRLVYAFMPARRLKPARVRVLLDALAALGLDTDAQQFRTSPLRRH